MAAGETKVSDVVVPEIFTPYVQQLSEQKSRLVQSGALARNAMLDELLAGGGKTFNVPSFQDLDDDDDNVSSDDTASVIQTSRDAKAGTLAIGDVDTAFTADSTPNKISTGQEVAVRLSRNNSWASADLAAQLAGEDPVDAIASRVANYWNRRLQAAFLATMKGVSKDNGTNDSGDYANDVAAAAFAEGVTNFTAEAALDALQTMGDSQEDLGAMMVHSAVYNRMQKNNLIDFIPDARGETDIPTFLGRQVIVDDGMPIGTDTVRDDGTAGVAGMYETWFFGAGAVQLGMGSPKVPTEIERYASAGNGGGMEVLFNRVEWCIHPVGHAFAAGSIANGGPSNAATSNNLNIATSWNRVYPERKQIKFARLVTRES